MREGEKDRERDTNSRKDREREGERHTVGKRKRGKETRSRKDREKERFKILQGLALGLQFFLLDLLWSSSKMVVNFPW